MKSLKQIWKWFLSVFVSYAIVQQIWVLLNISRDPQETLAQPQNKKYGITVPYISGTEAYTIRKVVEDGIERISYLPKQRRFETPIVMQHGMWHAAWCWHLWQAQLAEWGWESHAISLPGHGKSPTQRNLKRCTLDYYLSFLRDEIERYPVKPILMGHSMGGALAQWYLKYIGDDLPAMVMVAPWVADSTIKDGLVPIVMRDPLIVPLMMAQWDTSSWVRNPRRAAEALISPGAYYTPEELHARLDSESALVIYQHNPPFWEPPRNPATPILLLAGEKDAVVSERGLRRSAAIFQADYSVIENAAHNLMMESNWLDTVELIHNWLKQQATVE